MDLLWRLMGRCTHLCGQQTTIYYIGRADMEIYTLTQELRRGDIDGN